MGLFTKKLRHILVALLFVTIIFSLFTFFTQPQGELNDLANDSTAGSNGEKPEESKPIKLVGQQLDDGSVGVHAPGEKESAVSNTPDSELEAKTKPEPPLVNKDEPVGYKLEDDTPEEIKAKARAKKADANPDLEPFVAATIEDSNSKKNKKGSSKSDADIKAISDADADAIAEQQLKDEEAGIAPKRPKSTLNSKGSPPPHPVHGTKPKSTKSKPETDSKGTVGNEKQKEKTSDAKKDSKDTTITKKKSNQSDKETSKKVPKVANKSIKKGPSKSDDDESST